LFPQFLWSAQQAIEKYLKAILLYNRIVATDVRHDLAAAMTLVKQLPFSLELSKRSLLFIEHLAACGGSRYLDVPYYVDGHILVDLDLAVWEVRRFCQVLNVFGKKLPPKEQAQLETARTELANSSSQPRHKFCLRGGYLETILLNRKHPSRDALLWHNACFGVRFRKSVKAKFHLHGENPILFLFPEVLEELRKYVHIPNKLASAYRTHLAEISADPTKRP
jgi:hypothetical protein